MANRKYNEDIIEQLIQLQIADRAQIEHAMDRVVNRNDPNEITQWLLDHPQASSKSSKSSTSSTKKTSSRYGVSSSSRWQDDYKYSSSSSKKKDTKKRPAPSSSRADSPYNNVLSQSRQHQYVIEYWARIAASKTADDIAEILLEIITSYSVPAFRFRYGNDQLIGIYKDGLVCHQLQKKQCSALFGPRIKHDGLDKNMVYKFKFLMKAGNVSFGLVADDYVTWNECLHNVNTQRHAMIWKNGFYHHNSNGTRSNTAISKGHVADIYKDGDIVELEVNLSTLKCFVRNLTDSGLKPRELPISPLVNYGGSSNYMQIVIGFFDDFGSHSWVQGAGVVEVVEQRGEYHKGRGFGK